MDFIDIIKKYVKLSVKRDDLTGIIVVCDKIIEDRQKSYEDGKYSSEKSYNDVGVAKYRKINASDELTRVLVILKEVSQLYEDLILNASHDELITIYELVSAQKTLLENDIKELEEKRIFARTKGDEAFKINSFYQEEFYNNICNECFDKIEEISPQLNYYIAVESELKNRIAIQNSSSIFGK